MYLIRNCDGPWQATNGSLLPPSLDTTPKNSKKKDGLRDALGMAKNVTLEILNITEVILWLSVRTSQHISFFSIGKYSPKQWAPYGIRRGRRHAMPRLHDNDKTETQKSEPELIQPVH